MTPAPTILQRLAWAPRAGDRPAHGISTIHEETVVPATLDETFAFFSEATNLERLTPPWLNFRIHTPGPIVMREGLEIDYHIVLYGLTIPWRSRIDVWEPGVRFVDRQVLGPYRWWHHEHRFESVSRRDACDRPRRVQAPRTVDQRTARPSGRRTHLCLPEADTAGVVCRVSARDRTTRHKDRAWGEAGLA